MYIKPITRNQVAQPPSQQGEEKVVELIEKTNGMLDVCCSVNIIQERLTEKVVDLDLLEAIAGMDM